MHEIAQGEEPTGGDRVTLGEALDIVAQQVIAAACRVDEVGVWWENYPELSEGDWIALKDLVERLTPYPLHADYEAAYAFLEARATDNETN